MDDDEAFLYGDQASDEPNLNEKPPTESIQASSHALNDSKSSIQSVKALPPLMPCFANSFDQTQQAGKSLVNPTSSIGTQNLQPSCSLAQQSDPILDQAQASNINNQTGFLQGAKDFEVIDHIQAGQQAQLQEEDDEEEEEEEDEQGAIDESDDDLDIILEGDTSQIPLPSRLSLPSSKVDTSRDLGLIPRPIEQINITTEYRPLERTDFKPPDASLTHPIKPHPPSNLSSSLNPVQPDNHNRLPTPENFHSPSTPPPQHHHNSNPVDVTVENPIMLSGYDDKDGTALMDFDFDAIPDDEKGWNKPNAHIADWFNYGFDEATWRLYVMKQKRMRQTEGWAANPFAAFATGNLQQAWDNLPDELKEVMMQTILGNPSGSVNNNHGPQMGPSMPSMMVMNPMLQGIDLGAYAMQGMSSMMGGGNAPMNGGHNNSVNEVSNRGLKQDLNGSTDQAGDSTGVYGDELVPREQQHHEQRLQDQMRHMQHMQHMGMTAGFLPGMDLTAMFGNQEHAMFMNGPQFNGMMEMPQMAHMQHIPPQMQQQMVTGPPINIGMAQNMNSNASPTPINPSMASQTARSSSPGVNTPVISPGVGPANPSGTSGESPRLMAASSPVGARGRGRGGRGRGNNAQASAFLAAAAARGRGRVISAANSVTPSPINATPATGVNLETSPQVSPAVVSNPPSTSVISNTPVQESSPERPALRPVSPLPSNVPTGPRRSMPILSGPPPRGPRITSGYFDKDAAGARGDEGLDYGGGGGESPREERKASTRKHNYRSEREKPDDDGRPTERHEDRSERSRSKSRDKEIEDKESFHRSSKSRHRHRGRSKSKELEHRSSREKSDKDKEDGTHKSSSKGATSSRRSRRSRRPVEGEDKDEDRDTNGAVGDEREREKDKEKEEEDHHEADYSLPVNNSSRKRKPKEDRSSRSKRERAE
ncbi:hypothetical protein O181_005505 [Austropuccinia psidii MF-1]|uniref:Pre-mRNA polyadenylation factor Fip1 domain-containing protein n=1 Tax=Austropuccinia psidii MF-1 TaxID=1389203 RepID=A0A9Q3GFX0_9BASI|nr:hypothetical protein [Austropuccinia psidii MF-1]